MPPILTRTHSRGRRFRRGAIRILLTSLLWLGRILYYLRVHRVLIAINARTPKVLVYHACEPVENDFIRGLQSNIKPDALEAQLAFLRAHYRVISVRELTEDHPPPRTVVLTFDDGYRSVYERAWPHLRTHGLPATVYLVTDVVGNGAMVWVNELNWHLRTRSEVARLVAHRLALPPDTSPEALLAALRDGFDASLVQDLITACRRSAGIADVAGWCRDQRLYLT